MTEVAAITAALRAESRKWEALSVDLAAIGQVARRLCLEPGAFLIGDGDPAAHSDAYDALQTILATVLDGAATEFKQLGAALARIADAYTEADAVVALDLNEIYRA